MLGKYFNEYPFPPGSHKSDAEKAELRAYVPPGWQSWASPVQGNAYAQDHYKLNVDGVVDDDLPRGLPRQLARRACAVARQRRRRLRLRRGRAVPLLRVVLAAHAVRLPAGARGHVRRRAVPPHPGLRRGRRLGQVRAHRDAQAADRAAGRDHRRDLPQADPLAAGAGPERRRARAGAHRPGRPRQHLPDLHQRQRLHHGQPPARDRQVHPVPERRAGAVLRARARHRPRVVVRRRGRPTSTSRRRSPR